MNFLTRVNTTQTISDHFTSLTFAQKFPKQGQKITEYVVAMKAMVVREMMICGGSGDV